MKLIATCERRSDNTVILLGADGNEYTFHADAQGDLACDIEDEATIELALHTGNFYPAEGHEDAAERLLDDGAAPAKPKRGRPPKAKAEPAAPTAPTPEEGKEGAEGAEGAED